jgi:hypothetical protein
MKVVAPPGLSSLYFYSSFMAGQHATTHRVHNKGEVQ